MADLYQKLAMQHMGAKVPKPAGDTPGERIMAMLPAQPSKRTMADLFAAFITYGRENGWLWGGYRNAGPKVLDGIGQGSDCGSCAQALQFLAIAPAPYGLGLDPGALINPAGSQVVTTVGTRGAYDKGIITMPLPSRGIDARFVGNIEGSRNGAAVFIEHRVVRHQNRCFDVNTGRIYNSMADIIVYSITRDTEKHPEHGDCEVAVSSNNPCFNYGGVNRILLEDLGRDDAPYDQLWNKYRCIPGLADLPTAFG